MLDWLKGDFQAALLAGSGGDLTLQILILAAGALLGAGLWTLWRRRVNARLGDQPAGDFKDARFKPAAHGVSATSTSLAPAFVAKAVKGTGKTGEAVDNQDDFLAAFQLRLNVCQHKFCQLYVFFGPVVDRAGDDLGPRG